MDLRTKIAEMISTLGPSVREQVIDVYAKKERNRRTSNPVTRTHSH